VTKDLINVAQARIKAVVFKTLIISYLLTPYVENHSVLLCFPLRGDIQVQNPNVKPGLNRDMRESIYAINVCGAVRM
jgi:hypothetical protein